MEPSENPEARISELERPLADVARTTELGAATYAGAPTPLLPYGYAAAAP